MILRKVILGKWRGSYLKRGVNLACGSCLSKIRTTCAAVFILFSAFATSINATDLLKVPALKSDRAFHSLLLDVTTAGSRIVAVGERGHIIYSDDNAATWKQANTPVSVTLTAIDFPTEKLGWAVGHDGAILHSRDGGENWILQFDGYQGIESKTAAYHKAIVQRQQELIDAGTQDQFDEYLENLQLMLEEEQFMSKDGPSKPLLDVHFLDEKRGFAVGAYGSIFTTVNAGELWQPIISIDNSDGFHFNAIRQTKSALFIVGEMGVVWRSFDNGLNWDVLQVDYEGSFLGAVSSPEYDELIALGLRGAAFRTRDRGDSWVRLNTESSSTISSGFYLNSDEVVLVSYGAEVISISETGNRSHRRRDMMPNLSVTAIDEGKIVLVGFGGARTEAIRDVEAENAK